METEVKERKIQPIMRLQGAEYERLVFSATAHLGTVPEDLLAPEYWAHVANHMKPWAKIEARAEDGTWYAEYLVLDVGRTWAKVKLLSQHSLTTKDVSISQSNNIGLEVRFRGARKWSVVRTADASVMAEDMDKETAMAKMAELLAT